MAFMVVITTYLFSTHVCRGQDPTKASYVSYYNRAGKTIVTTYNFSPQYYRRKDFGVDSLSHEQARTLPRVTQWSDVLWIGWTTAPNAQGPTGDLKYIFRHDIITASTQGVMRECLSHVQRDIEDEWPGSKFTPDTEEYFALLGTPHGM